jgi:hypothetical protein
MSRSRKFVVVTALILAFTILTSGQTAQPVQLVVGPVIQKDAPIQVAGIEGNGDNAYMQSLSRMSQISTSRTCTLHGPLFAL